jgi:hypothetical protein
LLLLAAVFSARFEILQVRLVFLQEQNAAASGNFCEACSDTFSRFVKQSQKLFWMKKKFFHLFNNMIILNLYFVFHENTSE